MHMAEGTCRCTVDSKDLLLLTWIVWHGAIRLVDQRDSFEAAALLSATAGYGSRHGGHDVGRHPPLEDLGAGGTGHLHLHHQVPPLASFHTAFYRMYRQPPTQHTFLMRLFA